MFQMIKKKLREETFFLIAVLLAVITGFFAPTRIEAINFSVLMALFNLMLITLAFEKYRLLDYIAGSILLLVKSERSISLVMIATTAFLAMFITNDVALITVVPITIRMSHKASFDPYHVVTLEALAANIGSSLTPFGNPQNLYLFNHYKMSFLSFISITAPFVLAGLILLGLISLSHNKTVMDFTLEVTPLLHKKTLLFYILLFVLVILSILHILPEIWVTVFVLGVFLIRERKLIRKVDYYLLGTFVCFFIFIDHMTHIPFFVEKIPALLKSSWHTFIISALASQVINNVPSAILFSGFTQDFKPLLIGVNVGGIGTMIASLANLIALKLYQKSYSITSFKTYFYLVNISLLGIFLGMFIIVF